jgi:hypothetical protein
MLSRRQLLLRMIALRTLATGLPASLLLNPRRALSQSCSAQDKAQFIIFNTSGQGDPINANAPGCYDDPGIVHPSDPSMAPTKLMLRGKSSTAALPWSTLPQAVLDRSCFFHLMTDTPVHPDEPDVLKLQGATRAGEMLPSLLATQLAPCLQTLQAQPVSLGASTPSEALSSGGRTLPAMPAMALKATLASTPGPVANLSALRDQALGELYDIYRNEANAGQRAYLDALITSQNEVRGIRQDLLDQLASLEDNSPASQVIAALTLIQMKLTPVIAIHIPFGGDNHRDVALADESAQTVSGVATLVDMMAQLEKLNLSDQVSVLSLNVFGRTLGADSTDGRQHNPNHQLSLAIGKPFAGGVIGGIAKVGKDYGALGIDSASGAGSASGDIQAEATLASFGKTALAAIGTPNEQIDLLVTRGSVIKGALR